MSNKFELGGLQRRRAELLGAEGQAWIDGLPDLISDLESRWGIRVESDLAGGTEALVLAASTSDGRFLRGSALPTHSTNESGRP